MMNSSISAVVDQCRRCADECVRVAMNECGDVSSAHAVFYRLIGDCAELCDLTADLVERESPAHPAVRAACAEVCAAAAQACLELGLTECAAVLRATTEICLHCPRRRSVAAPAAVLN